MVLTLKYPCPFCQTEIEGRGVRHCPNCKLPSEGLQVDAFDNALAEVLLAEEAWGKKLDALRGKDGEKVYGQGEALADLLLGIAQSAEALGKATRKVRDRLY